MFEKIWVSGASLILIQMIIMLTQTRKCIAFISKENWETSRVYLMLCASSYHTYRICLITSMPKLNERHIADYIFNAFYWMKIFEFRLKFHWSFSLRVQLTISKHWFGYPLGIKRYWFGDFVTFFRRSEHIPDSKVHGSNMGPTWVLLAISKHWFGYPLGIKRYWFGDFVTFFRRSEHIPDSKVHGSNMGPTWVLLAPGEPHVGPINLAIRYVLTLESHDI